jgi:hypothetical protein
MSIAANSSSITMVIPNTQYTAAEYPLKDSFILDSAPCIHNWDCLATLALVIYDKFLSARAQHVTLKGFGLVHISLYITDNEMHTVTLDKSGIYADIP